MPVVPQQPVPPVAERERLVEKIARELSREGEQGEPLIFENSIQDTKKFFAIVVWSEWRFIPTRQRASIILEAYQKYDEEHRDDPKGPHLAMASGLTWDEADAKGLFPFSIYPHVRDGVDSQAIHNAMVQEGGIETASGVKLFFASRNSAEAALQRLYARFPEARWTLSERIPSAQDD
ncbi:MAG TPA: hypothetical protein VMF69_26675 [Gemmataceae bacterium]|nr:hypothetical protein [Gemmataceae bacterium]